MTNNHKNDQFCLYMNVHGLKHIYKRFNKSVDAHLFMIQLIYSRMRTALKSNCVWVFEVF